MNLSKPIEKIEKFGALLVFPVKNKKEPNSLWAQLHPRTPMRWEWSDEGDDKVARMWHMMKELSSCGQVVYSKWYQNRATFFSKKLFTALTSHLMHLGNLEYGLSIEAREILEVLQQDSPLSTKELKEICNLQGRLNEGTYNAALRQLFQRFLIVGFGEKEDGAFPSSMMGATSLLYEEEWLSAQSMSAELAQSIMHQYLDQDSLFSKQLHRIESQMPSAGA